MNYTSKIIISTLTALALHTAASAAQDFNFEDPKGINTVRFNLDAPLESISGTTNGVSGNVSFDAEHPEKLSGTIRVDATSIQVPNAFMMDHLHSENWINSGTYGEITFEAQSVSNVVEAGSNITADVTGIFTLHGVSKEITVPVTLAYLPGRLADRSNGQMEGDLLVLRSQFSINRSEFGIMPGQATDKVAEEVVLSLALAGFAITG